MDENVPAQVLEVIDLLLSAVESPPEKSTEDWLNQVFGNGAVQPVLARYLDIHTKMWLELVSDPLANMVLGNCWQCETELEIETGQSDYSQICGKQFMDATLKSAMEQLLDRMWNLKKISIKVVGEGQILGVEPLLDPSREYPPVEELRFKSSESADYHYELVAKLVTRFQRSLQFIHVQFRRSPKLGSGFWELSTMVIFQKIWLAVSACDKLTGLRLISILLPSDRNFPAQFQGKPLHSLEIYDCLTFTESVRPSIDSVILRQLSVGSLRMLGFDREVFWLHTIADQPDLTKSLANLETLICHKFPLAGPEFEAICQVSDTLPKLRHLVLYTFSTMTILRGAFLQNHSTPPESEEEEDHDPPPPPPVLPSQENQLSLIVDGLLFSINREQASCTRREILLSCRIDIQPPNFQQELSTIRETIVSRVSSSAEISVIESGGYDFVVKQGQAEVKVELAGREKACASNTLEQFFIDMGI